MDDQSQGHFAVDGKGLPRPERGAEVALHHREDRLDLRPLAVFLLGEPLVEREAIPAADRARLAVFPFLPAHGRREDAPHAEFLAAEHMRAFALVAGVAEDGPKRVPLERLREHLGKLDDVRPRTPINMTAQDDVAFHVAEGRQFRETALPVAAVAPAALRVVPRDVPRLHAGGVDGCGAALRADQAAALGEANTLVKEPGSAPFFRRRFCA